MTFNQDHLLLIHSSIATKKMQSKGDSFTPSHHKPEGNLHDMTCIIIFLHKKFLGKVYNTFGVIPKPWHKEISDRNGVDDDKQGQVVS